MLEEAQHETRTIRGWKAVVTSKLTVMRAMKAPTPAAATAVDPLPLAARGVSAPVVLPPAAEDSAPVDPPRQTTEEVAPVAAVPPRHIKFSARSSPAPANAPSPLAASPPSPPLNLRAVPMIEGLLLYLRIRRHKQVSQVKRMVSVIPRGSMFNARVD